MIQSIVYEFLQPKWEQKCPFIVLCEDAREAQRASEVATFLGFNTFVLPDFRVEFGEDLRSFQEEIFTILSVLREFYESVQKEQSLSIIFAPFYTLIHKMPSEKLLRGFTLEFGSRVNLKELKDRLFAWGYEFVDLIEGVGEVSMRGDIIDIFPPCQNNPQAYRISLFDEEIDSIRAFELQNQRCIQEELESLDIYPAFFALSEEENEKLLEKIEQQKQDNSILLPSVASCGFWFLTEVLPKETLFLPSVFNTHLTPNAKKQLPEYLSLCLTEENKEGIKRIDTLEVLPNAKEFEDFSVLFANIPQFLSLHQKQHITILAKNQALCKQANVPQDAPYTFKIGVTCDVNILSAKEVILSLNTPTKTQKKRPTKILLDELKVGNYVVHEDYGIALFLGLKQAQVLGSTRDFIELGFLGEDRLLVPVENLGVVDRYIADSGSVPMLDRLGKGSFGRLKEKVKVKLLEIAQKIIDLAAKREMAVGHKLDIHKEEIAIFQAQSGFSYTQDQQNSINAIFKDLASGHVMDRLLSGDVGFGKTEVAMNAMFAAYLSGLQSMLIVPTTLLAYQHFATLKARFERFGVQLARFDRFLESKEKKRVLEGLKDGKIQMVVGTHALLGVEFKNLGLIVVDEEHKFGVKQKEQIKELSSGVHFLSMSATPIPRTLNMALSKIKGLSELKEAPIDRLPTRTFVKSANPALIKEVILRELRRGGAVFYIHNNIASIEAKKSSILKLLPHLKIAVLHSQIPTQEAENIMLSFAKGEINLLLSTSIVESGLHLPNANTIIVERADRFGIADLHQLRGRVGRAKKEGFCYFLVEDEDNLTQEAQKRLLALEGNAYLGAGSALAYHDLEIRGGGNLLGEAQSGHIKNIGYGMYLRMLEDMIYKLTQDNSEVEKVRNVDIKLQLNAFLNAELIPSDRVRLELYRRLSLAKSEAEIYEIEGEIEDRFGKIDEYTKQFLELMIIKILSTQMGFKSIMNYNHTITLVGRDEKKTTLQAPSREEYDILGTTLNFLRQNRATEASSV